MLAPSYVLTSGPIEKITHPKIGDVFRVQAEITEAFNMPSKVFLHQRVIRDRNNNRTADVFIGIADPEQVVLYPEDNPDEKQNPNIFRKSSVDILAGTLSLAEEARDCIYEEAKGLAAAYAAANELHAIETLRFGAPS